MNHRPGVVARGVEGRSGMCVHLDPDTPPLPGQGLPKLRDPSTLDFEPPAVRAVAWVHKVVQVRDGVPTANGWSTGPGTRGGSRRTPGPGRTCGGAGSAGPDTASTGSHGARAEEQGFARRDPGTLDRRGIREF